MSSNIINDIVEDIEIKPTKSKFYLKWVIRISMILIALSFVIGSVKTEIVDNLNHLVKDADSNKKEIKTIKADIGELKETINTRINERSNYLEDKISGNHDNIDKANTRIDGLFELHRKSMKNN
jgi:uncharacterized protein YoxC